MMLAKFFRFCILLLVISHCYQEAHSQLLMNGIDEQGTGPVLRSSLLNCTPLFSYDTPPAMETGITADSIYIWSGSTVTGWYYKANSVTGLIVDSIPKPAVNTNMGGDMDVDGTHLWTIIEQLGTLYQLDPVSGAIVSQILLPNHGNLTDPNHWGVACQDGYIWIAEYAVLPVPSFNTLLFKMTPSGVVIDSFLVAHRILPIKFINGDLWGMAFDVPFIYKYDLTNGSVTDSVPACVNDRYGLMQNDLGFWLCGVSAFNNDRIHLFDDIFSAVPPELTRLNDINIYPNPARDFITVEINRNENKPGMLQVYDRVGKKVYEYSISALQQKITIDTRSFTRGLYIARYTGDFLSVPYKFILE